MYLAEPGWRIGVKAGYEREFCYMMMPGQDFYHRLLDGEIYLHRHDEKLCLACACVAACWSPSRSSSATWSSIPRPMRGARSRWKSAGTTSSEAESGLSGG